MKNYLDLVPISSKVHKKQNRMSLSCIILAVFLVSTIFGMADMFVRSQILKAKQDYGNWHISLKDIGEEDARVMASRPDIGAFSAYGALNYRLDMGYTISDTDVVICGSNDDYLSRIYPEMLSEGHFPNADKEVLITKNAKELLHLQTGDSVTLRNSDGTEYTYTVSGFLETTAMLMQNDCYGIFLKISDYKVLSSDDMMYFVQFADTANIQDKIDDLKQQFHLSDEQISANNMLLGLLGQSRDSFMLFVYYAAGLISFIVLLAGVMMIASSLNSNVAQRTEFFGMIRCIGATPKQIIKLVTKEAFHWCRFAIPCGIVSGLVVIWILCFILRYLSPKYFGAMPEFGVSIPSIIAGIMVGLLTVILAVRSPAKKAAKVSPLTAVSGNANHMQPVRKAANTGLYKIDTALGIHHAKSSRKNLILMTGSFALSIILFLSFSVTVKFMQYAVNPLKPWTPDLSIVSADNTCTVDRAYMDMLKENPIIKSVYGRMFAYGIPVMANDMESKIDLISYEPKQFDWSEDYLLEGSLKTVQEETFTGLIVHKPQSKIRVGDTITLYMGEKTADIRITGMLSDSPFNNDADTDMIICSETTFQQITGQSDYTIIDMQLKGKATDADVDAIRHAIRSEFTFLDRRINNSNVRGTYYCFGLFIYGFLILIALITALNIVNSIAMSVTARTKQYGIFRAIGLSTRQLTNMIIAEASTYAILGSTIGTVLGLILNKVLFGMLVSYRWGDSWSVPRTELGIIILTIIFSVILAVYGPTKKICNMSIVDTLRPID